MRRLEREFTDALWASANFDSEQKVRIDGFMQARKGMFSVLVRYARAKLQENGDSDPPFLAIIKYIIENFDEIAAIIELIISWFSE